MTRPAQRILSGSKKSFGMYQQALALASQGVDLIHMELGRPFSDTPQLIKDAAIRALGQGLVHYSDMRGELPLRQALAAKLKSFNAIDAAPDDVLVTNGLTHASYAAFMATIDPGDEVILLEPYYPQHVGKIELAGGKVVLAPLDAADNFSIRADLILPHVTPRTRAIVLVNPANPTGRVHTRAELEALAQIAIAHDLIVIADEVYEHITYDAPHISIASLPGMAERTISLYAFTKAYAMDGWRLGYTAASPALTEAMLKISTNMVTHVNTFIQYGALAAITDGTPEMEAMVAEDRRKRDIVVRALNQMPGIKCALPEGTIYAFPDISGTGRGSQQLAEELLAHAHVVVEAGGFYGAAGDRHLRVCFGAESVERIEEGMVRMARYLNTL